MFDLTSSKLLILAIVALLVVGPKDFPVLLRTIGRYMGMLRKHATEFRSQFDEAIRESELDQMREQVEQMSRDIEKSVREADAKVASEMADVGREADDALKISDKRPDPVPAASTAAVLEGVAPPTAPAASGPPAEFVSAAPADAPAGDGAPPVAGPTPAPLPRPGALASDKAPGDVHADARAASAERGGNERSA